MFQKERNAVVYRWFCVKNKQLLLFKSRLKGQYLRMDDFILW